MPKFKINSLINLLSISSLFLYRSATNFSFENNLLLFNHEAKSCNGTTTVSHQSAHGLKRLAEWKDSDFVLLELDEAIPADYNVFLSGWSALDNPDAVITPIGIHHPSADSKKYHSQVIILPHLVGVGVILTMI